MDPEKVREFLIVQSVIKCKIYIELKLRKQLAVLRVVQ